MRSPHVSTVGALLSTLEWSNLPFDTALKQIHYLHWEVPAFSCYPKTLAEWLIVALDAVLNLDEHDSSDCRNREDEKNGKADDEESIVDARKVADLFPCLLQ